MTYYIRYNNEPKERASFYIVQNVGALLEEDHQNGLAHFLEHMAFNGTENFEGKGIINTLEQHGVSFGGDINAYTHFNETVYNLSNIPVNKPGLLDTCLLILYDWSNGLLLTDEEIDLERGVILEEWRTRRTSGVRMQDQYFPVLFKDSKYAHRDVIGDTMVIKYHEPDLLRQFYHDWYRTDLQSVIIVGDFDVDEMEQKVRDLFSQIPAIENPQERPFYEIPAREGTSFVLATDPEAVNSQISIYIIRENRDLHEKTFEDLRNGYILSLYNSMARARIQELLQQGEPPFINGTTEASGFVRGYDAYYIGAVANPGEEQKALETIMIETERIKRYGFTESELARAKLNFLSNLESRYKQRDKIRNDSYIRNLQNHFLVKAAVPGIDFEYEFANLIIPGITVDEVFNLVNEWIKEDNRVVIVGGHSDVEHISEEEVIAILNDIKHADISVYEDRMLAESLIDNDLSLAEIELATPLEEFDAVEWVLSNGLRVVYRHADYEKDNVAVLAYSPGGSSLLDDSYVPSIMFLNDLIPSYGVGEFDAVSLQQMLAGKRVSVAPFVHSFHEGFSGNSAPRDFETLMQLIYLFFEQPRFDLEAHNALMLRLQSAIANLENDPSKIMSDSINLILSDYHPRERILNLDLLEEVNFDQIREIYQNRIYDASDFVFFIVGNIGEDTVKLMSQKYLGSLSKTDREESWIDRGIRFPEGRQEKKIEIPLEVPKASVNVFYSRNMAYTPENMMYMRVLRGILNLRYIETIREDEGGSYGVWINSSLRYLPIQEGFLQMGFDTDPEKVEHLKSILFNEIEKIVAEGPKQNDFNKTIENILKDREQTMQHNSFWMSALYDYYITGLNLALADNYENIARAMTSDDLHHFVKDFFEDANLVDILFLPKTD